MGGLRKANTIDSVHNEVARRTVVPSESMNTSKRSRSSARSPRQARTRNPEHREKIRNASSSMSPKRRTCAEKLSSSLTASSVTKEVLDENDFNGPESSSSLHDGVRRASSMHYSRRDVRSRRIPLSQNSSRHGRRHRDRRSRRSSSASPKSKETIRVIQFDHLQACGVSMVHTNDVHSESSKNADVEKVCLLMQSDSTIDTLATEVTGSLEGSFHGSFMIADAGVESDDKPLILEETDLQTPKVEKRTSVMGTFKAVSKMLATPHIRRKSAMVIPDKKLKLIGSSLHL